MALIDNGVYVHGRRVETPKNLDETYRSLDSHGGIAW
ncbi:transporter, partial [Pseudomonas sp. BGM005]|nr:transporter [Pseudomonas sp. BG5]